MAEKPIYEKLETRVQELKTGYTQLEKKLHEAELFSEEIMTYMSEGFVQTDIRGTIIFINQRLSEMLGYLPEQIIGKYWLDIVPAEQQAIAQEAEARRVLGHTDRYEIILRHKDGHRFPVMIGAGPRFDKQSGEFIGTMGVVTDITDQKKAEKQIAEALSWYQEIFEGSKDAIFISDENARFVSINSAACNLTGYDREELRAMRIPDLHDKMDLDAFNTFHGRIIGGDHVDSEARILRRDGRKVDAEFNNKRITVSGKHYMHTTARDITERKLTEEALRESEARFRSIYEHTAVGLAQVSLDFKIMSANEAYCNMLGYQEKDLVGKHLKEITHPEVIEENIQKQENLASGKIDHYRMEKKFIHKKGQTVHAILDANLIRDVSGNAIYFLGSVVDITERKQAGKERDKLQSQLLQAQKMESVGRLAGGVAHDFNNMLGVILGHTELALLKTDEDNDLVSDLKEIQKAAKRSANTTKQLLAFARKDIISPKQIDLNDTVESMLNMLRRLIGEDIDLVWQPAAHLWPVKMDPSQIDQILANLCVNARDAISGVGKLTIETGRKTFDVEYCNDHPGFIPGDFVLLAVSDNGSGMDKETLENLFEPFFTTKEVGKGTGLGLATVYGIVKQNNGFINVYSEPGQGSTFKIYLPRLVTDEDVDKAVPEKKAAAGGTETILLVEDEPTILRMTRMMLERKGYSVLPAATPGEAIDLAKTHADKIDLLMTDVVMPEMNGRDLAGQITALYPDIRLLFMSGYTANVIAHQGVLDDGVAFIQKPFSMAEMTEKVREILDTASDKA
ncbi:MAG: PAS domain S-box protein [Desulfotignum sp.]|nr:PAS domain S-box protein [Desulfotignum sp.]